MSDLKLTLYPPASYSFKNHRLLSIAAYAGLKVDVVEGFEVRTQGKEESFLNKVRTTTPVLAISSPPRFLYLRRSLYEGVSE